MPTFFLEDNGHSIELKTRGWPVSINNLLVAILIGLFCLLFTVIIIANLAGMVSDDWYLRFDWWWRILVYLGLFLGTLLLVAGFPLIVALRQLSFVRSLRWDQISQQLQVTRNVLLFFRRRQTVPFDEISDLQWIVGEEHGDDLDLHLLISTEASTSIAIDLRVQDVNLRAEAMDLFLRLARTCGLKYYGNEDTETVAMRISASREQAPGFQSIPQDQQLARYELDQTGTTVEIPPPQVGDFQPDFYHDWNIRLEEWEPGKKIHFLRPAPTLSEMFFIGIAFGVLAAIVFGISLSNLSGLNRLLAAGVAGVITVPIAGLIFRFLYPRRETLIDFGSQQVNWSRGLRSFQICLRDVKHVLLWEIERKRRRSEGGSFPVYQCQLYLTTSDGSQWMLTNNDSFSSDREVQRHSLEPLAAALAKALNVDWRWRGHRDTLVKKMTDSATMAIVLLGLIGLVGFFGWVYWQQSKEISHWNGIAAQLEQIGTRVTQAGVSIGDERMFGSGMYVEASTAEFNDQDLARVLELLEPAFMYGLDLSNTAVSDAGIKLFADQSGLRYLSLRGTKVTPEAAPVLAQTQLSGLDLRDTALRLEHLEPFQKLYGISILLISDELVSMQQLSPLEEIGRLRAVLINDRQTTERWLYRGGIDVNFAESNYSEAATIPPGLSRLGVAGEIIFLGK